MRFTFDISETLARVIAGLCAPSVTQCQYQELLRRTENIMSAIETLRTAVNGLETTSAEGLAAMESAFTELAADIANIPNNSDVEAEAARLSNVATSLGEFTAGFGQRLRDLVPTEVDEPLPPVEEEVDEVPTA